MSQADELAKALSPVAVPVGASLAAFITGTALLLDDARDFGKLGNERNPPLPHHYLYGLVLMFGGMFGIGLSLMSLIASDPKVVEALRAREEELRIARRILPPEVFNQMVAR
jgi:hypothetical protein